MKNEIEYIIFLGFSYLTKILGLNFSRKLSTLLAAFFYFLIPIRKKVTIDNLKGAFPNYSEKKIHKIAFATYRSFAITLIETLYVPHITKEKMINSLKCVNIDVVSKKKAESKGVIILTAHFGNWEYLAASLALQLNIPFYLMIKPQRNTYVTDFLNKTRAKWGNPVIPLGVSIRKIYSALKENKFVAMAADQRGNPDGPRINFMGRSSSVYEGPAVLALKSGADIVLSFSIRQPDYSYKVVFSELKIEDLPDSEDEKIKEICRRYLANLEELIRRYPEQWLWMHKRWKY
ncbi:MAG TPA: lysophospholipid acyltransferase family protein [Ignavibacteriaceae bacterium]|nr:lysophospholipid acyltransferase family protein [Ignavibacteriaceae bacterium]